VRSLVSPSPSILVRSVLPIADRRVSVVFFRVTTGPPFVVASLLPGRLETLALDISFAADVRVSARVVVARDERAAAVTENTRCVVHLTGHVDSSFVLISPKEVRDEDEKSATESFEEDDQGEDVSSSESWGSDVDEVLGDDGNVSEGDEAIARTCLIGDDDASVAARLRAKNKGIMTGDWHVPSVEDVSSLFRDGSSSANGSGEVRSGWAYHLQTPGARVHKSVDKMPEFAYTGELQPGLISPRRRVPSRGWSFPPPDYATTGWPTAEFESKLQRVIEIKTPEAIVKMRASCSLARAVMDAVAALVKPGVSTDFLDHVVHVMTVSSRTRVPPPIFGDSTVPIVQLSRNPWDETNEP